jgi:hypothetical protein
MQQFLHILIVDRDRCEGLATVCGSGWLLPIVRCPERTRAGPLAAGWLAEHGLSGDVIGQWLGHLTPANDAMDWLMVVDARSPRESAAIQDLRWVPLEQLQSSASFLDYQQWALEKAIPRDVPMMAGPFGSMTWFDELRGWLEMAAGTLSGSPVFYKVTPHEVVLRITTARGAFYFKGLTGDRIVEAAITSWLSSELPDSFARTRAFESRADGSAWWLTEHCLGTTMAADFTRDRAALVATTLGRIQQQCRNRITALHVPDADLATAAASASALLRAHVASEVVDRCDAAIAGAQRTVSAADLPRGWVPLDLDGGNVLVDNESVRFIDLDDSRVGAVPLALSTFLRRAGRLQAGADWPQCIEVVHRAYEKCWTPHLELRERWPEVDVASLLIDCHLGWQRLLQNIERGEVHGVRELAATRTAQRLARALDTGGNADAAHGIR